MSAVELLSNENALALRLMRKQTVPHDFWLWLSGLSNTHLDNIETWIDPSILRSIEEIIEPNLTDVNEHQRIQWNGTDAWIAAILGFANHQALELKLSCSHPFMAVSLLPLYRSLATRKLPEALQQTRNRLAELLVLIAMAQELGEDFVELLHHRGAPINSPYAILNSSLRVDLVSTGILIRQVARAFDPAMSQFDDSIAEQPSSNEPVRLRADMTWSDPQLLWQVAGELMAKKAEIVLPRQWADVAVPWTSIGDHWNALTHRLSNSSAAGNEVDAELEYNADDDIVSDMIDDLLAMQADVAEVSVEVTEAGSEDSETNPTGDSPITGRAHSSHGTSVGAPRMDATEAEPEAESEEEYPETDVLEPMPEPSAPKIAIVEISSRTDTIFANIMRRQIATARNSDTSVCLVALCVESDDAADSERIAASRSNGLAIWQEKLVNWLAEHPQVHEPFAFVTTEGQLVFSMQDIERTEATNIVRDGLVTALSGKPATDQSALSRVNIPARYYAGIGSACPNAGFAAEQLIEATWRCLSAAQNQGKATIKSIEVF